MRWIKNRFPGPAGRYWHAGPSGPPPAPAVRRPRTRQRHPPAAGFPIADPVGVDIELLGQFGQRLLAPEGGQGYFRLGGRVVATGSSAHQMLQVFGVAYAIRERFIHLTRCSDFRGHLCFNCPAGPQPK